MMKSKTVLNLLFIGIALLTGITTKSQINMKTEKLNQTITSFKETPLYLAKIETSAIGFDIRINDLPVLQFNEEGGGTQMELPINQAILSSGKQKLTVRVFPLSGKDEITADAEFKITLIQA